MTRRSSYRAGAALAVAASVLLVWLALGVGIIGRDGDPANRLYLGVLVLGCVGALAARFEARGMAVVLSTCAFALAVIATIAVVAGLGLPWSGPAEVLLLNAFFVAAFATAAWFFRQAGAVGG